MYFWRDVSRVSNHPMQIQNSVTFGAMMAAARGAFTRGMAPLGSMRVQQLFREGLPKEFHAAFDFLFTRKLNADDLQVVKRVEEMRAVLASSGKTVHTISHDGKQSERSLQEIAATSSVVRDWGTFLYLCAKGFQAQHILELGSCVGISGSYLASAPTCREFVTIERSSELAALARGNIQSIFPRARIINRAIDDVLAEVISSFTNGIDLYYIDANHYFEPTLRYFEAATAALTKNAVVVFDDIHWSKPMWDAWQVIQTHQGFSLTIDVGRFGICVWQGGAISPAQYNVAKYAGWVWKYTPR